MNQSNTSWLKFATYALCALILIGLSLPWVKWLDLFSRNIGIATIRGWNIIYLVLPALAAIVAAVTAAGNSERKWLGWSLIFSAASLVSAGFFGVKIFTSSDSLAFSRTPLIGFWITLLAFLGMIGVVGIGFAKNTGERQ